MIGKQLSRWTMAWFAMALLYLLGALGLGVMGFGGPGDWLSGPALAMVHLFALGWLCQMMLGSLIQFMPVLCARDLLLPQLALPALLASSLGIAMLGAGFMYLDGWEPGRFLLALAPVVIATGFGLVIAIVGATLFAGAGWRQDEGRLLIAALIALIAVWATGAMLALALTGISDNTALLGDGLSLHALLGAGGWLTLGAMGVSYKLFPMFLIAPEQGGRLRNTALGAGVLSLVLVAAAVLGVLLGLDVTALKIAAVLSCAVTSGAYLAEIRRIWQTRRRPRPEVNMLWSRAALAYLALAALLGIPAIWLGDAWAGAAIFAALAGWLSTLTLAQMIKIVSFLTWIQVYATQLGRVKVPMVHELTDGRSSGRWMAVWVAGAGLGTLALLIGSPLLFRLAALALLAAVIGLCHEAFQIRRLHHLPQDRRPASLPPVILPPANRSSNHDHPRPAGA